VAIGSSTRLRVRLAWWIRAASGSLTKGSTAFSIANDLARRDDSLSATVICDAPIWEIAGKAAQIPPNPQLLPGEGTLHRADTIEAVTSVKVV